MQFTIFSTTTCPYCKMLKDYLDKNSIKYTEKLVDQDDVAREEMMNKSGGYLGVPFSVIVKDDGAEDNVLGFDKGKLDKLLGLN